MHRLGGTNLDFDTCNLVGHITLSDLSGRIG